jgi:predicted transcriptional regulator
MKYSRALAINSALWQEQVKHKLLDGFGVEDIALWLNCHRSHVAAEVKRLRAKGDLAKWWGRA